MEKLAQDLKKGFLRLAENIKTCKPCRGNENGDEPKLESVEKLSVQERAIHITAARGPKRPSVPKGAPPQTS
uniref:Uncharacterized protein n=1 Tax=Quercus lobata TaxID=97700 RepID=A0A7N2R6K1_QUELO